MLSHTHTQCEADENSVYVKIADLGISRIMSPGGTMGFKGSPGFMAPEILKYMGLEAVTVKVRLKEGERERGREGGRRGGR